MNESHAILGERVDFRSHDASVPRLGGRERDRESMLAGPSVQDTMKVDSCSCA